MTEEREYLIANSGDFIPLPIPYHLTGANESEMSRGNAPDENLFISRFSFEDVICDEAERETVVPIGFSSGRSVAFLVKGVRSSPLTFSLSFHSFEEEMRHSTSDSFLSNCVLGRKKRDGIL